MIKNENTLKPDNLSNRPLYSTYLSKKILVIAPAWIGDMVMAQSLFKFIKSRNPTATIDILAPSWTVQLAERMPEINEGIVFPFGHGELNLLKRFFFAKTLTNRDYDQAIVLPGSFKSALTALWAKIPVRTGWVGEWRYGILNDARKLIKAHYPLMIQQFAALGISKYESLPASLTNFYPSLSVDKKKRQAILDKLHLDPAKPILALCPGAEYGLAKRWPVNNFAHVANEMLQKGWQVWIFGSVRDKALAESLNEATHNNCADLTGKTSLLEAVDLLSLANGIIANDSGLMHISAALNRPLVVIYGSSTPHFTPPLSNQVRIIHLGLECSPCFKRTCPLQHLNCMKQITSDRVLSALTDLVAL